MTSVATPNLTIDACLAGLPSAVANRLRTESVTPLIAALGLSDAFWLENPYKDQKGAARAVRIVTRDEAIRRCTAFYQLKGGTDVAEAQAFFERTFAPQTEHDGQVSFPQT
ncbi:MAG: hypothetical protein AAFQ61_08910 [Cyanobacteria bacterium J06626_23]